MYEYLEQCLTGPNLLPSSLLVLIIIYGLLVLVGALDIELFDFDLDGDLEVEASITSAGFVALRFLNLGNVPLMIWLSVFGIAWWATSLLLWFWMDQESYVASWQSSSLLVIRNLSIAMVLTKFITQPLVRIFDRTDEFESEKLIGKECVVSTTEATPEFGQAKLTTDGAPLLLDIRTKKAPLAKGDRAVIVDFDSENRVYLVTIAKQNEEV